MYIYKKQATQACFLLVLIFWALKSILLPPHPAHKIAFFCYSFQILQGGLSLHGGLAPLKRSVQKSEDRSRQVYMSQSHVRLESLLRRQGHQTSSFNCGKAKYLRSRFKVKASKSNGVVILPGLGNNKQDYEPLAALLRKRDLTVEIAQVSRPDW